MKRIYIYIYILIMVSGSSGLHANTVSLHGYYKMFFTGFKMPVYQDNGEQIDIPALGAVTNRLRLKLTVAPTPWLGLEAAYDFSPRIQDPLLFDGDVFVSGIDPFSYRADDFPGRLYPQKKGGVNSFGIFHNLDRLFVTIKTRAADIFIGRQAIAWGSARFVNPTDVIAPFTFNELDIEDRRGVDAVRVRVPMGMMAELDMGYIFGDDFEFRDSAFYLRGKTYELKTDISVLLMGFRENLLIGLDIARSIGGAGAWLEAAYVVTDFFKELPKIRQNYFRASVGMDYNFSGTFYGFCEYHYNGAGKTDPVRYSSVFLSRAYREGAAYLMARHYFNLGITMQVTPLIPFTGLAIANLNDGSITLAPSLEYNIAENIYLSAGAYLGIGKNPEVSYFHSTRYHSEFGAYPTMFYTSFRVYF